ARFDLQFPNVPQNLGGGFGGFGGFGNLNLGGATALHRTNHEFSAPHQQGGGGGSGEGKLAGGKAGGRGNEGEGRGEDTDKRRVGRRAEGPGSRPAWRGCRRSPAGGPRR